VEKTAAKRKINLATGKTILFCNLVQPKIRILFRTNITCFIDLVSERISVNFLIHNPVKTRFLHCILFAPLLVCGFIN
jgi:hypothetical protein